MARRAKTAAMLIMTKNACKSVTLEFPIIAPAIIISTQLMKENKRHIFISFFFYCRVYRAGGPILFSFKQPSLITKKREGAQASRLSDLEYSLM
jgi:hypothetical protein